MFTRPGDLSDAEVAAALVGGWDLDVEDVVHAPVGFGSHHWWVADASGGRWFATADDLRTRRRTPDEPLDAPFRRLEAALSTASALRDTGLAWVVAPVRSGDGAVVRRPHESYALALHPVVEGRTFGWGPYDDDDHRDAVVARLVELHGVGGCRDEVREDDLGARLGRDVRAIVDDLGPRWAAGPFATDAWQLVRDHDDAIRALLDRCDALVAGADHDRFVLTHGEPHRANTIVTTTGVVLVDWDTVLLGPPERDLWRLVGEDPRVRPAYEERTGVVLDDGLLEAHALRWDLADVASCLSVLRAPHGDDRDTRTAWSALRDVVLRPR